MCERLGRIVKRKRKDDFTERGGIEYWKRFASVPGRRVGGDGGERRVADNI
jgi:hypothetical protein